MCENVSKENSNYLLGKQKIQKVSDTMFLPLLALYAYHQESAILPVILGEKSKAKTAKTWILERHPSNPKILWKEVFSGETRLYAIMSIRKDLEKISEIPQNFLGRGFYFQSLSCV